MVKGSGLPFDIGSTVRLADLNSRNQPPVSKSMIKGQSYLDWMKELETLCESNGIKNRVNNQHSIEKLFISLIN